MNKRIKELAEQAKEYSKEQCNGFRCDTQRKLREDFFAEKFAELIVRECAEVAQDFVTVENNKLVEKVHISPWHLQDKIKEHFGVEE